jgi:uncharacterized protein YggE
MTVTGTAEIRAKPDRAVIQLGVETRGSTAQEAMVNNNIAMNKIQDALMKLGIPDEYLQTSTISLTPIYSNPPPRDPPIIPVIIQFQADNVLSVELTDLTKTGPAIDAALNNGANQVQNLSFRLADERPFQLDALTQAGRNAWDKANALAAGLNVAIDYVDTISEATYQVTPVDRGAVAPVADGKSTPVLPGQLVVSAQVQVRFVIKSLPASG